MQCNHWRNGAPVASIVLAVTLLLAGGCPQSTAPPTDSSSTPPPVVQPSLQSPIVIPVTNLVRTTEAPVAWGAVPGATSYAVYFGKDPNPPFLRNIVTTGTTFTNLDVCSTYYWRIDAIYSTGSAPSSISSFQTACPTDLPGTPRYPAPANLTVGVDQRPTLTWAAAAKASHYQVYFGESQSPSLAGETTDANFLIPRELQRGRQYFWRVVAANDDGVSTSPTWAFEVLNDPAGPKPSAPIAPPSGANDVRQRVRLAWSASSGSLGYDVEFGSSPTALSLLARVSSTEYNITTPLDLNTTYYWRVIARNNEGSNASGTQSFTTVPQPAPPLPPTSVFPQDGAVWVAPAATLRWVTDPSATRYDVYLGTTNPPPSVGSVTEPTFTPSAALTNGTVYYWRVEAVNDAGVTSGETWRFVTSQVAALGGGNDPGDDGNDPGTTPDPQPGPIQSGPFSGGNCGGTFTRLAPGSEPFVSANGRYVAFVSSAAVVAGDANGTSDVYVYDRTGGNFIRASLTSSGAEGHGACWSPTLSADGRYCAFVTLASLDAADTDSLADVYIHDSSSGVTTLITGAAAGATSRARISSNGQLIAFHTGAAQSATLFTITLAGTLSQVATGAQSQDISATGRYVTALRPRSLDVFDTQTHMVNSVAAVGTSPVISADGGAIGYIGAWASKLEMWVTNPDDTQRRRMTRPNDDGPLYLCYSPEISDNGLVASYTYLFFLEAGSLAHKRQIIVSDATTGVGAVLAPNANGYCEFPSLNSDGSVIAFVTTATNLIPSRNLTGVVVVSCGGN